MMGENNYYDPKDWEIFSPRRHPIIRQFIKKSILYSRAVPSRTLKYYPGSLRALFIAIFGVGESTNS